MDVGVEHMGEAYLAKGCPEQAMYYLQQALKRDPKSSADLIAIQAVALNNLTKAYKLMNNIERAIPLLEEALARTRAAGVTEAECLLLQSLREVYLQTKQNEKALTIIAQALVIERARGNKPQEAMLLALQGLTLDRRLGRTREALASLQEATRIMEKEGLTMAEKGLSLEYLKEAVKQLQADVERQEILSSPNVQEKVNRIFASTTDVILNLIMSPSWDAAQIIVHRHQDLLLRPEAELVFDQLIQIMDNQDAIKLLRQYKLIVQWCRKIGVEEEFRRLREHFGR